MVCIIFQSVGDMIVLDADDEPFEGDQAISSKAISSAILTRRSYRKRFKEKWWQADGARRYLPKNFFSASGFCYAQF